MVTYLGGSILITIFALGGSIVSYNLQMTENANNQIHSVEHHNKVMESGMNDKINQYEKDRIGQGRFGNTLGIGGPNAEKGYRNI